MQEKFIYTIHWSKSWFSADVIKEISMIGIGMEMPEYEWIELRVVWMWMNEIVLRPACAIPWTGLPQSRCNWVNEFRVNVVRPGETWCTCIYKGLHMQGVRWFAWDMRGGILGSEWAELVVGCATRWTCVWSLSVICDRRGSPLCVGLNIIWMDYSVGEYPPHTPRQRISTILRT